MSEASSSQAKEVITRFMDLEKIMSYIAVDRAIRNDDGVSIGMSLEKERLIIIIGMKNHQKKNSSDSMGS